MATVLIVDDQFTSRAILDQLVNSIAEDITTRTFDNPNDALQWCEQHQADLILTDYKMPGMNGVELTRNIRELQAYKDVPILVITIIEDKAVRYDALESGATDVINKPVDHHECRARCKNLLTLRHTQLMLKNRNRWLEKQVAESTRLLRVREREALMSLAHAANFKLDRHGDRMDHVARFSSLIASRMGYNAEECETLALASMLRDYGNICLPEELLLKNGPLNLTEFEQIKTHTTVGYEMLKDNESPTLRLAADIALNHHEQYNGHGYPHQKQGEDISLDSRIVTVADVFDALTSPRPYAEPWSMNDAIDYLHQNKGVIFDPHCVEAFCTQLDRVAVIRHGKHLYQDVD